MTPSTQRPPARTPARRAGQGEATPGPLAAKAILLGLLVALAAPQARAQYPLSKITERVNFEQKLDAQVPLDLTFKDEDGRTVRLGDYFGKRPVILNLVYYRCPQLCNEVLNGLTRSMRAVSLDLGRDFEIITVSIDPADKPPLAKSKKAAYVEELGRPEAAAGWHFLTGEPRQINLLADAIGFKFYNNKVTGKIDHAAGLVAVTPQGRVARYFFGVEFAPRDIQFGLVEASAGRIGSPIAKILLFCYDYDAAAGKYTFAIMRVTRILGVATAIALALAVVLMLRRERRQLRSGNPTRLATPLGTPVPPR